MMVSTFDGMKSIDIFKEDCKFHHIGLSVKSIDTLFPNMKPVTDPIQKVKVAFINFQETLIRSIQTIRNQLCALSEWQPPLDIQGRDQITYLGVSFFKNSQRLVEFIF